MTLEKHGLPSTAEMIRQRRENIKLKAIGLRIRSEEQFRKLKGIEKELNQLEVLNTSERLVEIFSRLRVRRTEQNQDEEYDFHGEEIAWNQVKQGLKVAYDPLVFDAAEKVAEEYIRLSNIS